MDSKRLAVGAGVRAVRVTAGRATCAPTTKAEASGANRNASTCSIRPRRAMESARIKKRPRSPLKIQPVPPRTSTPAPHGTTAHSTQHHPSNTRPPHHKCTRPA
eukprot:scaffold1206_cov124-Isochrysis_galbana.AAC.2